MKCCRAVACGKGIDVGAVAWSNGMSAAEQLHAEMERKLIAAVAEPAVTPAAPAPG